MTKWIVALTALTAIVTSHPSHAICNIKQNESGEVAVLTKKYPRASTRTYKMKGVKYTPLRSANGFVEEGKASWYGRPFHGRKTANGETYNMFRYTAAHPTLPIPSCVKVTNLQNGKSVIVRVNDRLVSQQGTSAQSSLFSKQLVVERPNATDVRKD